MRAFLYTVEHTAGSFTGQMICRLHPQATWLGDAHMVQRGRAKYLDKYEQLPPGWPQELLYKYAPEPSVLFSAHHSTPGSALSTQLGDLNMSVVTSMRDPLLAIHTKLWRSRLHGQPADELEVARRFSTLVEEVLAADIFVLPVDVLSMQDQHARRDAVVRLAKLLGLGVPVDFQWEVVGDTALSPLMSAENALVYRAQKDAIVLRNASKVKQFLPVALEHMFEQTQLIAPMRALGYRNLVWW